MALRPVSPQNIPVGIKDSDYGSAAVSRVYPAKAVLADAKRIVENSGSNVAEISSGTGKNLNFTVPGIGHKKAP